MESLNKFENNERPKIEGPRINKQIRVTPVRVIDDNGNQLGVMPTQKAVILAFNKGLDLVEVSPNVRPPVCKFLDSGKMKYEEKKKKAEAKKKSPKVELKQLKFRPKTDQHDVEFKVRNARKFIGSGHKVQFEVVFRGRENAHVDEGRRILDRVIKDLLDIAKLDSVPTYDNGSMIMIMGPR